VYAIVFQDVFGHVDSNTCVYDVFQDVFVYEVWQQHTRVYAVCFRMCLRFAATRTCLCCVFQNVFDYEADSNLCVSECV